MRESESVVSNLLHEVDTLTYRIRSIKYSFKTSSNIRLKERLIQENKVIFGRITELINIAELLVRKSTGKINFSVLLLEKAKRTLIESRTEQNLFFL